MNRGKKLMILAVVLVVLAGAAAIATVLSNRAEEAADAEETAVSIYETDTESVTALSWTSNGETVNLENDGSGWVCADDADFPLDETAVENILSAFAAVSADKTIAEPSELSEYGLEEPAAQITLTGADGSMTFAFGDTTSLSGSQYCSDGDGAVYLVSTDYAAAIDCGLYDLIVTEEIPTMESVTEMTIETASQTLDLQYLPDEGLAYSDEYVWFLSADGTYTALDTDLTEALAADITGLTWVDCVDYDAADNLSVYGLETPAATVTVTYEGGSFTLEIGDTSANGCYARIAGSSMVYEIDSTVRDAMLYTTVNDLMPDEVLVMDWDTVDSVTVTMDGQSYNFVKSDAASGEASEEITDAAETDETVTDTAAADETDAEADTDEIEDLADETEDEDSGTEDTAAEPETVWTLNGAEADISTVLNRLTVLESVGSAANVAADNAEEISFVIHRADADDVTLTFYQYNSSSCLVQLNGVSTVFVDREEVVNITEAVTELMLGD